MNIRALRHWKILVLITLGLHLSGCGGGGKHVGDVDDRVAKAVYIAEQQVGTPYRWGGESPGGFDCSGLIRFAYGQVGIKVPHSTQGLLERVHRVPLTNLRPGDILFFKVAPPKVSHVGLYIGDNRFVHAPSSGKTVSIASLKSPYWNTHVFVAGRL